MELSLQLIFSICFFNFLNNCTAHSNSPIHHRSKFIDLVKSNGYEGKSYYVETEDGYILRLDRISGSPLSPEAPGKPVVVIQHGILTSSETWVIWDPKESLAYLLADAGYDVWLSNVRGNTCSRKHKTLSANDRKFWNFTLDDLGTKDLPAQIDFALEKTGQSCLTYIGHSMGSTLGYILLSEKPEYNDKISFIVSLAPVVLWHYNGAGLLKPVLDGIADAASVLLDAPDYVAEVFGHSTLIEGLVDNFCPDGSFLCTMLMSNFFTSPKHSGLQPQDIRLLGQYAPSGTSLKVFQHYRQMMDSGLFRKYDYGIAKNIEIYGKKIPPNYNLQKTTRKIALIWTHNDIFANELNVKLLAKHLPIVVTIEPVPTKQFLHADFIFHRNGRSLIWNRIIELINNHHECSIKNDFDDYELVRKRRPSNIIFKKLSIDHFD